MRMLSLIAPAGDLSETNVALAADALRALGAVTGEARWLAEREAAEFTVESDHSDSTLMTGVRYVLPDAPIDLAVQDAVADRRRKILIADMDSTILTGETLDEMAAKLGLGDEIAAITAQAMAGELDFEDALRARVAKLKGRDAGVIEETLSEIAISPGAETLVRTMAGWGARCILCSGGFTPFTSAVRERLGFHEDRANVIRVADGEFTGAVEEPILNRDSKLSALLSACAERGLALRDAVAVGDGANDLPMIETCGSGGGLGVAYRAKPLVAASARVHLKHTSLCSILFLQGVGRDAFAT